MPITINVAGQVGQIKLPQAKGLWPLFETVINSIQSLEDTETTEKIITINAQRDPNVQLRQDSHGNTVEEPSRFQDFIVTDNGNGFTSENYRSFLEAYSQLKVKKGCKGIGRFLWLKAFDKVTINSTYEENGKWYLRSFSFSLNRGVFPEDNVQEINVDNPVRQTTVSLIGFRAYYRDQVSYSLESLARKLIEHCLPYFIMGTAPQITLKDNRGETQNINAYYRNTYADTVSRSSGAGGRHYSGESVDGYGNEIWIIVNGEKREKSVSRSTVELGYKKAQELGIVKGPKALGLPGAGSYLWPVLIRLGVCAAE